MKEDTSIYDPSPAAAGPAEVAKGHKPARVAAAMGGAVSVGVVVLYVLQTWTPEQITLFCDRVGVPSLFGAGLLWLGYKVSMRGISAVFIGVKDFNGNLQRLNSNVEHIADSVLRQLDRSADFDERVSTKLATLLSRTEHNTNWFADLFQRVERVEKQVGLAPAAGDD